MRRGEVSWKRRTEEGDRLQVCAHKSGNHWEFFIRQKRYDRWEPYERPELEDWLELLDGVKRRVARQLMRPEEVPALVQCIKRAFPDEEIG